MDGLNQSGAMMSPLEYLFVMMMRTNHPDGVPEQFRENANLRMKTANLMIDAAIRKLAWR